MESCHKWQLPLKVYETMPSFFGTFITASDLQNARNAIRSKDRYFFHNRLGKEYMKDKVIDHFLEDNSAKTNKLRLVHKSEHPNGGVGRPGTKKHIWETLEDWF